MKCLFVAAILMCSFPLLAEDAGSLAAAAAHQQEAARETAERFSRLETDLEALRQDNQSLRAQVAGLTQELGRLRDEQAKTATAVANNNPQEDLRKLAEKIKEVDGKRETDKEALVEEIKRSMAKLQSDLAVVAERPIPRHDRTPPAPAPASSDVSDTALVHTVSKGDTLSGIQSAYNAAFKKKGLKGVTVSQIKAANPDINWEKLKTGTKISIPTPPGFTKD